MFKNNKINLKLSKKNISGYNENHYADLNILKYFDEIKKNNKTKYKCHLLK